MILGRKSRKHGFVEDDVLSGQDRPGGWVIALPSFVPILEANEDARSGVRFEVLPILPEYIHIYPAPKNSVHA